MSVCDQSLLDPCSRQGTACSQLSPGGLRVCCLQPHKDGRQVATVQQMVRSSFQFRNPENVKSYERACWFENKGCARLKIRSCASSLHITVTQRGNCPGAWCAVLNWTCPHLELCILPDVNGIVCPVPTGHRWKGFVNSKLPRMAAEQAVPCQPERGEPFLPASPGVRSLGT